MQGICLLCQRDRELQNSHVIPKFVFAWLKKTAATSFMMESRSPNERVQDGQKRYWFCKECEQQIGKYETEFSKKIFYPIAEKGLHQIAYGDWFMKFCISVSWRVLLLARQETDSLQVANADEALNTWRRFLRGECHHIATFEQHCILFDKVVTSDPSSLPTNINRYVLRAIEHRADNLADSSFVYVKMGPVAVLGFTDLKNPEEWLSSKVDTSHGQIGGGICRFPETLWRYWEERARRYGSIPEQMSEGQQASANRSVARAMKNDSERLAKSHWLKAMQWDADMFGDWAFQEGWPKEKK